MSTLERMITEAQARGLEDGKVVVWDSRDVPSGTRLEIEPAPLSGYRALIQDTAGFCTSAWIPDSTPVQAAREVLGLYLDLTA